MSSAFKLSVLVMGMMMGVGVGSVFYFNRLSSLEGTVEVRVRNQIIIAETVADEAARARGLSGHAPLGINEGMLFRFDEPGIYPFWMKGMTFPIDIVWISGNRAVGFEERVPVEEGVADDRLTRYLPPEPVDKVLELAAGRVRILRAEAGDPVLVRPLVEKGYN
ncbi:MAG: DUF192 domain-containing protein [Candidatus Jorgensenbacteria bacterium]